MGQQNCDYLELLRTRTYAEEAENLPRIADFGRGHGGGALRSVCKGRRFFLFPAPYKVALETNPSAGGRES